MSFLDTLRFCSQNQLFGPTYNRNARTGVYKWLAETLEERLAETAPSSLATREKFIRVNLNHDSNVVATEEVDVHIRFETVRGTKIALIHFATPAAFEYDSYANTYMAEYVYIAFGDATAPELILVAPRGVLGMHRVLNELGAAVAHGKSLSGGRVYPDGTLDGNPDGLQPGPHAVCQPLVAEVLKKHSITL